MRNLFLLLIIMGITLNSCGVTEAIRTESGQNCPAIVEGLLKSKVTFLRRGSALLFNQSRDGRIIYGQILSKSDSGIFFLQEQQGLFHTPKPILFPLKDIQCVVDSNRDVMFGELPDKYKFFWNMEWNITSLSDSTKKDFKMVLRSNNVFSYCIEPGIYKITDIKFEGNYDDYVDKTAILPYISFNVEPNKINYLGTIILDSIKTIDSSVCIIPSMVSSRPMQEGVYAAQFGLLGALVSALPKHSVTIPSSAHVFTISQDLNHKSLFTLPIISSHIYFDNNKCSVMIK